MNRAIAGNPIHRIPAANAGGRIEEEQPLLLDLFRWLVARIQLNSRGHSNLIDLALPGVPGGPGRENLAIARG